MSESTCPGPACIDGPMIDGLCLEHYIEPLLPRVAAFRPNAQVDLIIRFLGYSDRSGGPNACWLWTSNIHPSGYGSIYVHGGKPRLQKPHRWAYEYFIGPIPDGLEIDHTCHTKDCLTPGDGDLHRRCVNPRHLEAVDRPTNIRRSTAPEATHAYYVDYREEVTHCSKGHEFTPENTQWRTTKDGYRTRRCAQDALSAGFGTALAYEKHVGGYRISGTLAQRINAMTPWQFAALLGQMVDAGVENTGAGERFFSEMGRAA